MGVTEKWRSSAVTHPGRMRAENQDRGYVDDSLGIFLVVDGLGGHAAGEKAAETAVEVIRAELAAGSGADAWQRIQSAVVAANNRICELAEANEDCRGMACVLTLAMLADDRVVVGHVGDSRLYLIWNGAMRKLTSDHSPVGEREDRGELTELEAMQHPRRHEVFRDVGSRRHALDDELVEMKEFLFKPDAAILLCSDGLSDLITSAQMLEIIERYDGEAEKVARELVDAANDAGGKDNITAIFVAGLEFIGANSAAMAGARTRHSITRARAAAPVKIKPGALRTIAKVLTSRVAFLAYGFVIGVVLALAWRSP
jgi:serine/threonine protein phosphatase PrpC